MYIFGAIDFVPGIHRVRGRCPENVRAVMDIQRFIDKKRPTSPVEIPAEPKRQKRIENIDGVHENDNDDRKQGSGASPTESLHKYFLRSCNKTKSELVISTVGQ